MATKKDKKPAKTSAKNADVQEMMRDQHVDRKNPPDANKPLVGEMVVIMGVPKTPNHHYQARVIIPAIAEAVTNAYDHVDIIKIKDVDLHAPAIFAAREGDQETIDFVNTGEGKALMALYISHDRRHRHEGNEEEVRRFEKMSPEEQQREIEHVRHLRKESAVASEKRRLESLERVFEVAQRWSTGVDLTPRERVHGAVRELYSHYGETRGADSKGRLIDVNPGRDYDKHFDNHFAEDIKARSIRAAKDLFGQK